ncbi:lysophospholipase [Trametes coccinea BRFM310]|uniref:Lysophospholipase n=1 Tax=Trametes coccinea (strain BRFM310) TaxID=1353009 RepID=A0A1Y2IZJ1_TRAC3|nr:lysophospholipase [Trametes coccinea BRFM310]
MAAAEPSPPYTEAWLDGPEAHPFYTRTYPSSASGPPKAVLLFIHGYNDHISRHADTHAELARRGLVVFAYDMRGFGRTALDEERRSPDEAFGRTNRLVEVRDLEWWVRHVAKAHEGLPIFLMGYSSGGGLALAFATRTSTTPSPETLALISGIIVIGPLLMLKHQPPWLLRNACRLLASIAPDFPLPANQPYEVRGLSRFSRDPEVQKSLCEDPMRKPHGTALGLWDMISEGEELARSGWRRWPPDLPLILFYGAADEINSPVEGEAFFDKLPCKDKQFVAYEASGDIIQIAVPADAMHELMHDIGDVPQRFINDSVRWVEERAFRQPVAA